MVTLIGLLLVVAAAAYVALPFLRNQGGPGSIELPATPEERDRWERQKAEAYSAIKEAELDQQMGKLSDVDFDLIRNKYAAQAVEAMTALDRLSAALRSRTGRKPTRIAYCPGCGAAVTPRANFCAGCGESLKEAVA